MPIKTATYSAPTVQFDQALSQAQASEGTARGNSPTNFLGQGGDYTQKDRAYRQLLAENAAIQSGNRGLLNSRDAQEFIQYGQRLTPRSIAGGSTPAQTIPSSMVTSVPQQQASMSTGTQPAAQSSSGGLDLNTLYSYIMGNGGTTSAASSDSSGYQAALDAAQAQIDAINAQYAGLIDSARSQGKTDQARARAVANVGGALYSPRTDAALSGISSDTERQIAAYQNAADQAIAGITSGLVSNANERSLAEAQLAASARSSQVNNLLSLYNTFQSGKQADASLALQQGALLGSYGGAPTLDYLQYQSGNEQNAFSNWLSKQNLGISQDQLQLQRDQLNQPDYQFVTLDDGTYGYFNPTTGDFQSLGTALSPGAYGSGGGSGGGGSSPYSNSPYSSWLDEYSTYSGKIPTSSGFATQIENTGNALYGQYVNDTGPYGPYNPSLNPFSYYNVGAPSSSSGVDLTSLLGGGSDYSSFFQ